MSNNRDLIRVAGTNRVFNRIKVLAVLMIPLALSLMAVSSVNVALPSIQTSMGTTSTQIQWILSGYALSFGIVLVPFGRVGDVLGRGSIWVLGLIVFCTGSLLSGLAPDTDMLILARFAQGIGAGMFNPQTTGMIQQYFSGIGRAKAYALFGLVISASVALGPTVTGTLIKLFGSEIGWRASFLWNVPLGMVGILLAAWWFPFEKERSRGIQRELARSESEDRPFQEQVRLDLDPIGMLILMVAVLFIMFPFMSTESPWLWLLLPAGIAGLALWVLWEKRYRDRGREPMVDLSLFKYSSFSYGTASCATQFLGSTSIFAVMAIFLQSGLGVSAFQAGFIGLPNAICSAYASYWAGKHTMNHGRRIQVGALLLIAFGPAACIGVGFGCFHLGWSFWYLMIPLAITGFGQGAMSSANQTLSMGEIPTESGGTAGGVKITAERITTAVGTAMVTGVLYSLAPQGWRFGLAGAYSLISVILLAAAVIAFFDLRRNGPGAEPIGRVGVA